MGKLLKMVDRYRFVKPMSLWLAGIVTLVSHHIRNTVGSNPTFPIKSIKRVRTGVQRSFINSFRQISGFGLDRYQRRVPI